MNTICISLGGSIIFKDGSYNIKYLKGFSYLINKHKESKFLIVTGGGSISRMLIQSAKSIINNNYALDEIGIMITRVNAIVVSELIKGAKLVDSIDSARNVLLNSNVAVIGGLLPGITTDSVAVLLCEALKGKVLINVSSNSYIYSKNPKYKDSKPIKNGSYDMLISRSDAEDLRMPGTNFVFDSIASKLAKRSSIIIKFVDESLEELEKVLEGKNHNGTTIK
ncbi:MAG: hypothetical protein ACP5TL_02885 [Candidatus Micrarchaeia archaeon]